ncbi:type II toxin-antitoxin system VapC family toxin [Pirellulimonas nuda]|uniref:type II toxin-antitoxin system VapC family toxin n=1 Tax=Pirellulimonas nuda TaxID=2528009 RepID=UPI0011A48FD1|nr:type II toxin-antitoxin system VapC family toxin [Pirellulimonas nuda]
MFLPIVSFHEQFAGWQSYLRQRRPAPHLVYAYSRLEALVDAFKLMHIASFDQAASEEFESLRADGVRIGTFDLRIASIALTRNFTLLTRNAVDFDKVPGLRHEDWTAPIRPK